MSDGMTEAGRMRDAMAPEPDSPNPARGRPMTLTPWIPSGPGLMRRGRADNGRIVSEVARLSTLELGDSAETWHWTANNGARAYRMGHVQAEGWAPTKAHAMRAADETRAYLVRMYPPPPEAAPTKD